MKSIVINLLEFLLIFFLSSSSVINGQIDHTYLPYIIDIKKNINNIKTNNLSSIGKELSYIPLETNTKCMIQEINKILFSEAYIFVSEINRLLQFDKNGEFIRQIGTAGNGPGEYLSVGDFCIDEQKKEIYIISIAAPRLCTYGFDGVFKNSFKLSFRPAQIIPKDQNNLMYHLWNVPGKNDPSWIITNRQGISTSSIKNNLRRFSQPGFIVPHSPLYTFNNSLHCMEFGIDTLYYIKKTQKKPYATFILGDLKMDTDPLISPLSAKDEKLFNKFWIGSIMENNDFLFIEFMRGISDVKMCVIYNKKTNTTNILKDNEFKNDLGVGIGFWPKQIINDNILIDYADAFDLLKRIIPASLRSKITENSNPVLMILK